MKAWSENKSQSLYITSSKTQRCLTRLQDIEEEILEVFMKRLTPCFFWQMNGSNNFKSGLFSIFTTKQFMIRGNKGSLNWIKNYQFLLYLVININHKNKTKWKYIFKGLFWRFVDVHLMYIISTCIMRYNRNIHAI